ncbi:MAG: polyketide synthase, partial [Actinomycetia bacterium]|nr:polyketide synthase [Actinomycetes bacterium]
MVNDADIAAVVGLSCRVAGAATADEFWRLLVEGRSSVSTDQALHRLASVAADEPGDAAALRYGAYLEDAFGFDASFFGISDDEAQNMDPQQRLSLELVWSALEDASIVAGTLSDTRVGVFIGAMRDDFASLISGRGRAPGIRTALGSLRSVIAGRITHAFRFAGPSLVIDTGQSSSLVAITLAIESLRKGDC